MRLLGLRSRLRCLIPLGVILALGACSSTSWTKLDQDEILSTLPELNMLSASLSQKGATDSLRQRAYHEFFARRGYTLADWDSTMAWYAKHRVKLFYDFYRLSCDTLTRLKTKLEKQRDLIAKAEERERLWHGAMLDTMNLLSDTSSYYYGGELLNKTFELSPSTPYDSTTRVYTEVLVLGLNGFPMDGLVLELRLLLSDTTSVISQRPILASGHYSLSAQVPDGKRADQVIGTLRGVLHPSDSSRLWVAPFRCYKYSSGAGASVKTSLHHEVYRDAESDSWEMR